MNRMTLINILSLVIVVFIVIWTGYTIFTSQMNTVIDFCIKNPDFYGVNGDFVINCSKIWEWTNQSG